MDYGSYYEKIFSQLSEEKAGLLIKLLRDEKCSMKNSISLGIPKEQFLKEFKSGPSLDMIEKLGSRFELLEAKGLKKAQHYIAFISYLSLDCPAVRAIQRMEEIEKSWEGGPYYSAFTFHTVDKKDYVLLGFEDGLDS